MILKVKSRKNHSFRQLLLYMTEGEERVPHSRVLTHNLKREDIDGWVQEFEENERYRARKRKNSTILTHEILSWHPRDSKYLTVPIIEDLTRQYFQYRNPNGLYVAAIHQAKDHYHVHICASGVEYHSGQAMRMSKGQMHRLKKDLQVYQKDRYPELRYSRVRHGKKREQQLEYQR